MTAQSISDPDESAIAPAANPGLKAQCLSYAEVLAQSVSVIAPSTVPAAILGLIFATSGNGAWLSFLLGMAGLVLVSININRFAQRSASAGSLYSYIVQGLGPTAGALGGWALLFGYVLTGMSTLCGFVIVAQNLLTALGLSIPVTILASAALVSAGWLAARDVQFSVKAMLAFESASIAAVLILGIAVWQHQGFSLDHAQLTLSGATPGGVLMGIVLVVFGFSGFESSTALGEEAKDPLKTIPRSVTHSVIVSGLIFIFMTYVVVLGFRDLPDNLAETDSPLSLLSNKLGLPWLGTFIDIGVLLSFFSCTLASINATARIVYSMARQGLAPRVLGRAHRVNKTPHVAIAFASGLTLLAVIALILSGVSAYDGQGYFGTLCSFGFLSVYILIAIAAPAYLRKIGSLTKSAVLIAIFAVVFMAIPFLGVIGVPGSALFPPPSYPDNLLIWGFVAYMVVGASWLITLRRLRPETITHVFEANDRLH
ncbi:APC family permease [Azomonas macrocytogenes]|uniref:Amino acid transporter n=1 Tax=Azomonas macrocytogenes TaxID=69962 RepID=A0A839T0R4_AZOMA|nr:APC family permease [Azomonas macrocytogenes]MBB3102579.1 amino acid transporter [Azomonas macrocytogenes]